MKAGSSPRAARRLALALGAGLVLAGAPAARAQESPEAEHGTVSVRGGVYQDSDETRVVRTLASGQVRVGPIDLSLDQSIDVVSSASIDVRTSPVLDAMSSASVVEARMTDRRFETSLAARLDDDAGRSATLAPFVALERDYRSLGAALRGSLDAFQRNTTFLGGVVVAVDRSSSVFDDRLAQGLTSVSYAAGAAQVVSRRAVARLRYDGAVRVGDQGSLYRYVRFGDWHTAPRPDGEGLYFFHTIGPAGGYREQLPDLRLRHALTAEWVQEVLPDLGVLASYRASGDDWGVYSHTVAGELRWHAAERWLVTGTGRYVYQDAADFWAARYLSAMDTYAHFTSDKELGELRGQDLGLDLQLILPEDGVVRGRVELAAHLIHYRYPGNVLIAERTAVFGELGAALEF